MASIKSNGWTFDFNNSNTVSNDQKKLRLGLEVMTNKHLKHKLRVNLPLDQIQSIPAFFYPDNGLIIKNEQDNVILKFSPSESLMMCSHQVKYANYYQEELAKPIQPAVQHIDHIPWPISVKMIGVPLKS